MKAVAIIGSNNKNSKTEKIINLFEKKIHEQKIDLDFEVIKLRDYNIKHCVGCLKCFQEGNCIFDDISVLKKKISDSQFIIFASPVYFHNVTGAFKVFIDRLSYLAHLMYYVGRIGITVSVSSNNGNVFVDDYLNKAFDYFGISNLYNLSLKLDEMSEEALLSYIDYAVYRVKKIIDSKDYPISNNLESIFYEYKRLYIEKKFFSIYEYKYWESKKIENYATFKQYFFDNLKV